MSDLFQLGDQYAAAPETAQIFAGLDSEIPLVEAGQPAALTTPTLPQGEGEDKQEGKGAEGTEDGAAFLAPSMPTSGSAYASMDIWSLVGLRWRWFRTLHLARLWFCGGSGSSLPSVASFVLFRFVLFVFVLFKVGLLKLGRETW